MERDLWGIGDMAHLRGGPRCRGRENELRSWLRMRVDRLRIRLLRERRLGKVVVVKRIIGVGKIIVGDVGLVCVRLEL